jgi:hypothetical protein
VVKCIICERCAHYLDIFRRADLVLRYSATVGCNLLTVVLFYAKSLPVVYRVAFTVPNTMLTNVMACRVYRDTKFGNQWVNPTKNIPSIPLQAPTANSSAISALGDNQSRGSRGATGRRTENGDGIDIFSSQKRDTS